VLATEEQDKDRQFWRIRAHVAPIPAKSRPSPGGLPSGSGADFCHPPERLLAPRRSLAGDLGCKVRSLVGAVYKARRSPKLGAGVLHGR
jgi:hypothetical protein